ncbi:MAG: hypothetical protein QOJ99_5514, partial [Bryobacterales bacterium]|nr:hypothetical protein [Bryobacterales bacterium]
MRLKARNPLRLAPVVGIFAIAILPVSPLQAGSPIRLAGRLSGLVADSAGRPQIGALVML